MGPQMITQAKLEAERTQNVRKLTDHMKIISDKREKEDLDMRATRHKKMLNEMMLANNDQLKYIKNNKKSESQRQKIK